MPPQCAQRQDAQSGELVSNRACGKLPSNRTCGVVRECHPRLRLPLSHGRTLALCGLHHHGSSTGLYQSSVNTAQRSWSRQSPDT